MLRYEWCYRKRVTNYLVVITITIDLIHQQLMTSRTMLTVTAHQKVSANPHACFQHYPTDDQVFVRLLRVNHSNVVKRI